MGSYSELRLGSFELGLVKNEVDPIIMTLFRETDKRVIDISPAQFTEYGFDVEDPEEDETISIVQYVCPVSVVKDRLELMGFTREVAEVGFKLGLNEEIARYKEYIQRSDLFRDDLNVLQELSIEAWLTNLSEIKQRDLKPSHINSPECKEYPPLLKYMLCQRGHQWYGFPGIEYRHFIRLLLDACANTDELIYDLTDLVLGGWIEQDKDLTNYADDLISTDFITAQRIIVLTEGITDRWILDRSLKLLYPHLSDYFRFMDFGEAKVEGGASALTNTVKAFIGAGIINRTIALFDNDTAAKAAMKSLSKIRLPENIVVLTYPNINLANNYPTIGPTGLVSMDVNGLAGSIELYLGEDVLRDSSGNLTPIQWKGYDSKLQQYQGEVLNKNELQNKFKQKLKACEGDTTKIIEYDWTGIRTIIDLIRSAFHSKNAMKILGDPEAL